MWKPLIRCSIVGGVILFLWYIISWSILPVHKVVMHEFINETETAQTILKEAPKDGIYIIPDDHASLKADGDHPPFIFVNVNRNVDYQNMTRPIVIGLITQLIGAALVSYLLLKAKKMGYGDRVWFVTIAGVAIAFLGYFPLCNWFHFPISWILVGICDTIIAWFLAGLVIAKLVKK